MAKTSFIDLPAGYEGIFNRSLTVNDRFQFPSIRLKNIFLSRKRIKGLTQKSLLPQCSAVWATFDSETIDAWNLAGAEMNKTGFKLFVMDYVLRMQNELVGVSTPSLLYQTHVGKLTIASPATHFLLTQLHPLTYWVSASVRGKKGMREPVLITESFDLPLEISINYKTNLTTTFVNTFDIGYFEIGVTELGDDGGSEAPRARFYAIVYSQYQGRTIENVVEIPFDLVADWKSGTATISSVIGPIKSYSLFLELYNVEGTLYVDNISGVHSGLNWVRDPICKDIDQPFTKAFYQVPKHWVPVEIGEGCFFGSVYYNAES